MTDSYADHPLSIGEIRSEKERSAAAWSPRDALINLLRRIDSGEFSPDALVVLAREHSGDENRFTWSIASPDLHTTLGMIERVKWKIQQSVD